MMTAVLGLSIALVGCNGTGEGGENDKPAKITALQLVPATLNFVVGDESSRLSYTTTPAGVSVELEWASSDESVATVSDKGVVTPVGTGEANITATVKNTEIKGACAVKVSRLEESLKFVECAILSTTLQSKDIYTINHSKLGSVNCRVSVVYIDLFTEGLYMDNKLNFQGASQGGYIDIEAACLVAEPDDNKDNPVIKEKYPNGVSFVLGAYDIAKVAGIEKKTIDMVNKEGKESQIELPCDENGVVTSFSFPTEVDNDVFMKHMATFVDGLNRGEGDIKDLQNAGKEGFTGPSLSLLQYVTFEEGESGYTGYPSWLWNYTPNAIVLGGEIVINGTESSTPGMYLIDYMDIDVQFVQSSTIEDIDFPGVFVELNQETGTLSLLSTALELDQKTVKYTTGTKPAEAPARMHKGLNLNITIDHALVPKDGLMVPASAKAPMKVIKK